jgi:hypothetical protein
MAEELSLAATVSEWRKRMKFIPCDRGWRKRSAPYICFTYSGHNEMASAAMSGQNDEEIHRAA